MTQNLIAMNKTRYCECRNMLTRAFKSTTCALKKYRRWVTPSTWSSTSKTRRKTSKWPSRSTRKEDRSTSKACQMGQKCTSPKTLTLRRKRKIPSSAWTWCLRSSESRRRVFDRTRNSREMSARPSRCRKKIRRPSTKFSVKLAKGQSALLCTRSSESLTKSCLL